MAKWHDTVQIDRIPVKQARTVRAKEAAAAAAATTMIRTYRISLTLPLPLLLFI